MEQFWLLRINSPPYDEVKFNEAVIWLLWSRYNRAATDYDAPEQTHCVSVVRYILYHAMDILLPKMYVWNMCRNILDSHSFHASIVPLTDAE